MEMSEQEHKTDQFLPLSRSGSITVLVIELLAVMLLLRLKKTLHSKSLFSLAKHKILSLILHFKGGYHNCLTKEKHEMDVKKKIKWVTKCYRDCRPRARRVRF